MNQREKDLYFATRSMYRFAKTCAGVHRTRHQTFGAKNADAIYDRKIKSIEKLEREHEQGIHN